MADSFPFPYNYPDMRFATWNVNGIRAVLGKGFEESFRALDADIFALNETKWSNDAEDSFPVHFPGYSLAFTNSKTRKGYSGVAVFYKRQPLSIHYGLEEGKYDEEGRVITLDYDDFYFVAAYVPNSGEGLKRLPFRLEYERDLSAYLQDLNAKKPVVYCGDLNVAHNPIDLKNPKANEGNAGYTAEERNALSGLLAKGFIDAYRYLYPEKVEYSWWSYRFHAREHNAGWRIDYFLISDRLKDRLKETTIHTTITGSDHCPVSMEIDLDA